MSYGIGEYYWEYRKPKMITFALPNAEYNASLTRRIELNQELKKKLPKAWKILQARGLLGGTYVQECTTRMIWSDLATEKQMYKHHPHIHCIGVSQYVHWNKLKEFSACLREIGLGQINYEGVTNMKGAADYIGKYLAKEGFRSVTFGVMRNAEKPDRECYCKHDDMPVGAYTCECDQSNQEPISSPA